jgi:hypothetical protein
MKPEDIEFVEISKSRARFETFRKPEALARMFGSAFLASASGFLNLGRKTNPGSSEPDPGF